MSIDGLTSSDAFLVGAAKKHFAATLKVTAVNINTPLDKSLSWVPALHFKVHDHMTIIAEVSAESPYPVILSMRRSNLLNMDMPTAVYAVCPEEGYLQNQADYKRLITDGFGLITVDAHGDPMLRHACIPLIQQISMTELNADLKGLPAKLRGRLAEAYVNYNNSAPGGVKEVTEIMEGVVLKAGRDAVKLGWLSNGDAKPGSPAKTLSAMMQRSECKNATAAIGAAQGYISMYRNLNHHFPKDKKQAAKKYRDCRHAFLEGIKKIGFFREQVRGIGLTGGL
ncbi:hypothetical protein R1A27_03480 [Methylobacterium sp. NMS12]|uniref:hypothetical protein n=1 Tax=Methylobacterium sp. NMS12 TaxID=3079766 RepID=UPI003F8811DD